METSLSKHELKTCPRCQSSFECKPGDIAHCQCYGIHLPDQVRDFIAKKYTDCFCRDCLMLLKQPIHFNAELHSNFKKR